MKPMRGFMNIPPSEKPRLTQLLREIRSVQAGRAWSLPIRYALDAVDSTVEDFLRHGYTSAHSRKASEMGEQSQTDLSHLHLNEKNFALFLEFLEAQGMRSARYFFRKLGYYFAPGQKKGMLAFFSPTRDGSHPRTHGKHGPNFARERGAKLG